MGKKQLWVVIAGLIMINCLTIAYFLTKQGDEQVENEVVATVGKEEILRKDWLSEIEKRYGREVLKELIDHKVIEIIAEKYNIKVTDEAVAREFLQLKTMYGTANEESFNEDDWREQIRFSLLLEEILTKDVVVPESELKDYYEKNVSLYSIPNSYHLSQIIVKNKVEAEQALNELSQGSEFAALAMERSVDEYSANQGGDIGYIREDDGRFSSNFMNRVRELEPGEWSTSIETTDGFAIVFLHKAIEGRKYSFQEVKGEIRRQIALDQIEGASSASAFWDEVQVEWFYDEG